MSHIVIRPNFFYQLENITVQFVYASKIKIKVQLAKLHSKSMYYTIN